MQVIDLLATGAAHVNLHAVTAGHLKLVFGDRLYGSDETWSHLRREIIETFDVLFGDN